MLLNAICLKYIVWLETMLVAHLLELVVVHVSDPPSRALILLPSERIAFEEYVAVLWWSPIWQLGWSAWRWSGYIHWRGCAQGPEMGDAIEGSRQDTLQPLCRWQSRFTIEPAGVCGV
jgi:hypothetical protein